MRPDSGLIGREEGAIERRVLLQGLELCLSLVPARTSSYEAFGYSDPWKSKPNPRSPGPGPQYLPEGQEEKLRWTEDRPLGGCRLITRHPDSMTRYCAPRKACIGLRCRSRPLSAIGQSVQEKEGAAEPFRGKRCGGRSIASTEAP